MSGDPALVPRQLSAPRAYPGAAGQRTNAVAAGPLEHPVLAAVEASGIPLV